MNRKKVCKGRALRIVLGTSACVMLLLLGANMALADLSPEVARYDANNDGIIQKSEAASATVDYFGGKIPKSQLLAVTLSYFSAPKAGFSIAAVSSGTVTRSFSTTNVAPGATMTVTLTPAPAYLFASPGYQVVETVPTGFTVTDNTAGLGTNVGNVWTFTQIGSAAFTYTLVASSIAGTYDFSGTFQDENRDTGVVSGATTITVGGQPSNSIGYSATVSSGQNTFIVTSNGNFGTILAGQSKIITGSVTLNNTGSVSATVDARFGDNVGGVHGLVNGSNVLGGSNFSLAITNTGIWTPLNDAGSDVRVATAPGFGALTILDARLFAPQAQPEGAYSGTVILTFGNQV